MSKAITVKNDYLESFNITSNEYEALEEQFSDLCYHAAWQLMRKNVKNNHTEELEDVVQSLRMAVMRAGRYYKRQIYIEDCLEACNNYFDKGPQREEYETLLDLWKNRTKHGANKQKFGMKQEQMLESLIKKIPENLRPNKNRSLVMDKKFTTYCKSITWNEQKSLGRKISKERVLRASSVSISEFDHIGYLEKEFE